MYENYKLLLSSMKNIWKVQYQENYKQAADEPALSTISYPDLLQGLDQVCSPGSPAARSAWGHYPPGAESEGLQTSDCGTLLYGAWTRRVPSKIQMMGPEIEKQCVYILCICRHDRSGAFWATGYFSDLLSVRPSFAGHITATLPVTWTVADWYILIRWW